LYFLGCAIGLRLGHLIQPDPRPPHLALFALLGIPAGAGLWFAITFARKVGLAFFGRGDLALAEEAIIRAAPSERFLSWGCANLIVVQPLGRELFMRGLLLPVVARDLGLVWAILATVLVELLLRLNIAWIFST